VGNDVGEETEAGRAAIREAVWERLRAVARPDTRFVYDLTKFIPDFEGSEQLPARLQELPFFGALDPFLSRRTTACKR
jgi:hypothetical protein